MGVILTTMSREDYPTFRDMAGRTDKRMALEARDIGLAPARTTDKGSRGKSNVLVGWCRKTPCGRAL